MGVDAGAAGDEAGAADVDAGAIGVDIGAVDIDGIPLMESIGANVAGPPLEPIKGVGPSVSNVEGAPFIPFDEGDEG